MKKALLITLIALMSCMLMTTALAADFTTPGEYVKHVSFDEIQPGIVVAGDDALKNTPTFASGTTELTFWGWAVVGGSNISGFSYSVNGGEKKTDASFVVAAGADVEAAAAGVAGGEDVSRFEVKVPVSEGTQLVRVFVDLENGDSEVFWIAEATVGEPSEYEDAAGTPDPEPTDPEDPADPEDPTEPEDPADPETPPQTGDANAIFAVAAAGIVLTVLIKKKAAA